MKALTTTLLLLFLLASAGCEDLPWLSDRDDDRVTPDVAMGPAATYERRLLFLATGPDLPAAATFDFTAINDTSGLRRAAGIRVAAGGPWTRLLDGTWSTPPMREPWRILPHGELRVIVNDAGEIEALALDGDRELRLQPGPLLAESSPDARTQLVLRAATLATADSAFDGVLLDAQAGRTQDATAAGPATSIEALLAHGSDYHAVVFRAADGLIAWVNDDGESRIHRGVTLATAPPPADGGEATDSAMTWLIEGPPDLGGRVMAEVADSADADAYTLVSGWVDDGGVRRDVFGLVRHR